MKSTDTVRTLIAARLDKQLPRWLAGEGVWPYAVNLGSPTTPNTQPSPNDIRDWIDDWRTWKGPGTITWANRRTSFGLIACPTAITLDDASQAAAVNHHTHQRWNDATAFIGQCLTLWAHATQAIAALTPAALDLAPDDRQRLLDVVLWLHHNPHSRLMLRQLPVAGIDTKWISRHQRLIVRLLNAATTSALAADDPQQPTRPDPSETSHILPEAADAANQTSPSFLDRCGLQHTPMHINVVLCDPHLRVQLGGIRTAALTTDDLSRLNPAPAAVLVIENKETGYAVPDRPGLLVIHGLGFNVNPVARITWIRQAHVVYWGDIDAPGFEWLNNLRRLDIPVDSILMDTDTLAAHQALATTGSTPTGRHLPHLTPPEQHCYEALLNGDHGTSVLLEQERLPWPECLTRIDRAIDAT